MSNLPTLTFDEASEQLLSLCELHKPPHVVLERIVLVYEKPIKIMCLVGDTDPALGAQNVPAGLYASNLFMKLLTAARALDWERVVVILEQAASPVVRQS